VGGPPNHSNEGAPSKPGLLGWGFPSQVTDSLRQGVVGYSRTLGTEAVSTSSRPPLRHLQLLPASALAGVGPCQAPVRGRVGTNAPAVRLLCNRLCRHAGACASAGERATAQYSGDGGAGVEAIGGSQVDWREKAFLAGPLLLFNVRTANKRIEKLRYIHRNPVKRGPVERPEDWEWSSFRHYASGVEGVVEIESEWTGRKGERMGMPLRVKVLERPHPSKPGLDGTPTPC